MPSLASQYLAKTLSALSGYNTVVLSLKNDKEAKRLIGYLHDARKITLTILALQFTYYFTVQQSLFASWVLVFILHTIIISAFSDGLDIESFRARVSSIGPVLFIILHNIPNIAVVAFLICEIVHFSTPKSFSILLQALLIGLVFLITVICALWTVNVNAGQAAVNSVIEGEGNDLSHDVSHPLECDQRTVCDCSRVTASH